MISSKSNLTYKEALSKSTEICSRSEKCSFDIGLKLKEWQLTPEESTKIISFLIQEKYIDHQRYAESFVRDKFRFNKWGKIKLAYQLQQKKIGNKEIQQALTCLPDDEYTSTLASLIQQKAKTLKVSDSFTFRNKLLQYVHSHGFETELALKIIGNI